MESTIKISLYWHVDRFFITAPERYDYQNQAWVINGRYTRCGHPDSMKCQCYGRLHEGEVAKEK